MENIEKKLLVKVLSGPHQGAEVALSAGNTTFGSSEECDVVFTDTLISPKHLTIEITNGKIKLIPEKNSNIFVNGKRVKTAFQEVLPFEFITLGTTHLIIGPEGEQWPPINVNDIPKIVSEEAPHPAATAAPQQAAANSDGATPAAPVVPQMAPADPAPAESPSPTIPSAKASWVIPAAIAGTTLFLVVLIAIIFFTHSTPPPPPPRDLSPAITEKIRSLTLPSVDTLSVEKIDDRYLVTGYVENGEQQQKLQRELRATYNALVRTKVWNQEKLVVDCQDTFTARGLPYITVSSIQKKWGILQLEGYVPNDDLFKHVKERLLADLYGLKGFQENIITPNQIVEIVQKALLRYDLTAYFTFRITETNLTMRGAIKQPLIHDWEMAKKEISSGVEKWLPINAQVTIVAPATIAKRSFFESEVASVTIGGFQGGHYITMRNGKRYSIGSILPSGYKISDITPDGIFIEKGTESITLKLEDI